MSSPGSPSANPARQAARVIVVGSVMFTFISYWRTAAVVLCDLGSTAYYIGGIVESAIGPAAPWFILAVMLFSYVVRSVYIESCSLFIRGGVYRVVRAALGKLFAKLAVSALIFDYLLTGPISGVSAGKYLVGLGIDSVKVFFDYEVPNPTAVKDVGSMIIAAAVTLYFFRLNLRGIHESSDRALKIMIATTVMVVVIMGWCGVTLAVRGLATNNDGAPNTVPLEPDLTPKQEHMDPVLGFLAHTPVADKLRPANIDWLSVWGLLGIMIAFGHSILAMSGEETLAQVYREVESPKLPNFRKAAFIVFLYSIVFTAGISFMAVWLIPPEQRTSDEFYKDNLISGLAMNVIGPEPLKLALNAFVVIVGFLILSGAVNTAIIGSNGVLNRVAEDGVLPDWFLKPHPRYGTTYRLLILLVALQLVIILFSRGDVILLGEAYAFGVVWSFVFQAAAMVVLRFTDRRPREYKVPLNIRIGDFELPIGLILIFLALLGAAVVNLFTKELATIAGMSFTLAFFSVFMISEYLHERRLRGREHVHLEQFNQEMAHEPTSKTLGLAKPFRKLVAIRSTQNLIMLEKALAETDPKSTDVVVMTAKMVAEDAPVLRDGELDPYDQELMTAVVQRAERAGKQVLPLIVPTNNPLYALLRTGRDLHVNELVVGASNKYSADEQLEQMAFYWINLHEGNPPPLTIRILGRNRDVQFDVAGGNRIPRLGESQARSVAELRRAGVGIDRALLVLDDSPECFDFFQDVLTLLDPAVTLTLAVSPEAETAETVAQALRKSEQIERDIGVEHIQGERGDEIVRIAREGQYDLILLQRGESREGQPWPGWLDQVLRQSPCRVFLASNATVPQEVAE